MIIYQKKSAYRFLVENVKERSTLGDLGLDGILKWILKEEDGKAWIRFIWLRIGKGGGLLCTWY
jgi:hypothetical protein